MNVWLNRYRKGLSDSQLVLTAITEQPVSVPDRYRLTGEAPLRSSEEVPTIRSLPSHLMRTPIQTETEMELLSSRDGQAAAAQFYGPMLDVVFEAAKVTKLFIGGVNASKSIADLFRETVTLPILKKALLDYDDALAPEDTWLLDYNQLEELDNQFMDDDSEPESISTEEPPTSAPSETTHAPHPTPVPRNEPRGTHRSGEGLEMYSESFGATRNSRSAGESLRERGGGFMNGDHIGGGTMVA